MFMKKKKLEIINKQIGWFFKMVLFVVTANSCLPLSGTIMEKETKLSIIEKIILYEEDDLDFEQLFEIYPANDLLISLKMLFLLEKCKVSEVEQLLYSFLRQHPSLENGTFFNWIKGLVMAEKEEFEKSSTYLKRSYYLDKERINPFVRLALFLYLHPYDDESAKNYLNESLEISNNYIDALVEVGLVLENQEKPEEALAQYKKALEVKELPIVYNAIGNFYLEQGKIKEGINAFKQSLALKSNLDGYIGLGDAHINLDDHYTAIEYFTKASKEIDCHGISYTRLAFTYVLLENGIEALRFFNLAFERDPTEEKLADLVYGYFINEDLNRASQLLENLKSNFGESYVSIIFDLIIMAKKGNVSEAQKTVDHLFDNYSDEEIELVKMQLNEWGIYINPEPE